MRGEVQAANDIHEGSSSGRTQVVNAADDVSSFAGVLIIRADEDTVAVHGGGGHSVDVVHLEGGVSGDAVHHGVCSILVVDTGGGNGGPERCFCHGNIGFTLGDSA